MLDEDSLKGGFDLTQHDQEFLSNFCRNDLVSDDWLINNNHPDDYLMKNCSDVLEKKKFFKFFCFKKYLSSK